MIDNLITHLWPIRDVTLELANSLKDTDSLWVKSDDQDQVGWGPWMFHLRSGKLLRHVEAGATAHEIPLNWRERSKLRRAFKSTRHRVTADAVNRDRVKDMNPVCSIEDRPIPDGGVPTLVDEVSGDRRHRRLVSVRV